MNSGCEGVGLKVGLYVDVSNINQNGGYGMRFDVLREFACRQGAEGVRLNAYVSFDEQRAVRDSGYRRGQYGFHNKLRDMGYKVIVKLVKSYTDEDGAIVKKSNADLDLAVDALLQSEKLDRVVLATGDGDFVQVVRALQNRGCRVEVVAFDNVSGDLRREADLFVSGYLIPDLRPIENITRDSPAWGSVGSRVRGFCQARDSQDRSWGYLRYLRCVNGNLLNTNTFDESSPYRSVFCHDNQLPENVKPSELPNRDIILEFEISENTPGPNGEQRLAAVNVERVTGKDTKAG